MSTARRLQFGTDRDAAMFSRAVTAGTLVRLSRGVFSNDTVTSPERQVREHLWEIVAHIVPDAVVADRSAALGGRLTSDGRMFVISADRRRDLILPGVRVVPRTGPSRRPDDLVWMNGLAMTSPARTLVDNLAPSRSRGSSARTLSPIEVEEWVVRQAQTLPADRLNRLRDHAKQVAIEFGMPERAEIVDDLFGAAQRTRSVPTAGPLLAARSANLDWDTRRLAMFEALAADLTGRAGQVVDNVVDVVLAPDPVHSGEAPFFEAYFSNFIEGTEFTLDEAVRIVYDREPVRSRPEDSHDVLGTFSLIVDPADNHHVASTADEFVDTLVYRHSQIMGARPTKRPGQFKRDANRAGTYEFVDPALAEGTLRRGFDILAGLTDPFDRAMFAMFLVSEVHPFDDGNGRVARLAMNAELSAAGRPRIIIATVFRNEYQTALRQMSREGRTALLVRTLNRAWRWSAEMDFTDQATARHWLELTHATIDSTDAEHSGIQLRLPSEIAIP